MDTATQRITAVRAVFVFGHPRIRVLEREVALGYVLLLPALLLLAGFLAYPFLIGLWLSVTASEVYTSTSSRRSTAR